MNFRQFRRFATNGFTAILFFAGIGMNAAHAGIPVADASNLTQNVMTAVQTAQSYAQQIEQYGVQLAQYEQEIKNSVAPAAYLWDQASNTITKLTNAVNQVEQLRNSNGGLDSYLSNFENPSFYSNSPCFKATGCPQSTYNNLLQSAVQGGNTSKAANDAALRAIDQQQAQLQADAAQLQQLQSGATSAVGQMSAIQSANQLASNMSNNLLQMRGLMLAQMQAEAAKRATDLDKEAKQAAVMTQLQSHTYTASPATNW